jgi:large subunit ribosomal protein L6
LAKGLEARFWQKYIRINMSRIGKLVVEIPQNVKVSFSGGEIKVVGPKGELTKKIPSQLEVKIKPDSILVSAKKDDITHRSLHGTYRALVFNMVKGVADGWTKELELVGTGYRVGLEGEDLSMSVGFSHPVKVKAPEGIVFKVEKTKITVEGIDKELVGQISAQIRSIRPPEPYKGKGIKYVDEVVRRKPGKAAKTQGTV